jgi:hypothetical protein
MTCFDFLFVQWGNYYFLLYTDISLENYSLFVSHSDKDIDIC